MNSDEITSVLRGLREEAIAMAAAPSVTRDAVDRWHSRTLASLESAYGPASPPVRDFSAITFDDAPMIDAAERILREKAAEEGLDLGNLGIRLPSADHALRRGLHEAAELLLSLTI